MNRSYHHCYRRRCHQPTQLPVPIIVILQLLLCYCYRSQSLQSTIINDVFYRHIQRQHTLRNSKQAFIQSSLSVHNSNWNSNHKKCLNIHHPFSHNIHKQQQPQQQLVALYVKVDPYRDSNNIRPSLHPITINILVQVLKLRASSLLHINKKKSSSTSSTATATSVVQKDNTNDDTTTKTTANLVWSDEPLDIVVLVSTIAANSIAQRQKTSTIDAMILTKEEQQTITGRVLGVMIRYQSLQQLLYTKCYNVPWIQKYNEWNTFGLIQEVVPSSSSSSSTNMITDNAANDTVSTKTTSTSYNDDIDDYETLLHDPIVVLNRAECLLALFIHTIEIPELIQKNCTVPDNSQIDFLDDDRRNVLLS